MGMKPPSDPHVDPETSCVVMTRGTVLVDVEHYTTNVHEVHRLSVELSKANARAHTMHRRAQKAEGRTQRLRQQLEHADQVIERLQAIAREEREKRWALEDRGLWRRFLRWVEGV
ncbi:hypothetical protein [Ralstonia phage phiRSL1]|uniref:Uncharacterized protein n=1 Tax=Ralstonia phage phiRSL1 TaxID=1980924 RepID=B2ZYB6_9CAUD|nr:hypothetical protein RSL1_ORF217 [Ralstonia phage phiRSL1]BAG41666.1 hypothetical protein [Ralstonia phage phiRSL1]